MVDAATPQDGKSESMEEILQSIKRIMDDNTEAEPKPAAESDVFELTDPVKEEATVEPEPAAAPPSSLPVNSESTVKSVDAIFSNTQDTVINKAAAFSEGMKAGLMSDQSASAAATSFKKIADVTQKDYSIPSVPSPQLRSGNTVEDLVLEALRPMLKEWLDTNLPTIVQKTVEKEIKRIVALHCD